MFGAARLLEVVQYARSCCAKRKLDLSRNRTSWPPPKGPLARVATLVGPASGTTAHAILPASGEPFRRLAFVTREDFALFLHRWVNLFGLK